MASRVKAQIHMDDKIIKDDGLEKLLEKRQELKGSVSEYRQADKKAKEKIQTITTPLPYRVGRFIISKQPVAAKSVAFETEEGTRVNIKAIDED